MINFKKKTCPATIKQFIQYLLVFVFLMNTAKFHFERHVFSNEREELTRGIVFFDKNYGTSLFMTEPITQEIYITNNECNIFYPDELKVISLLSSAFGMSFVDYFLGQGVKFMGLDKKGFKVEKMEKINEITRITLFNKEKNTTAYIDGENRNKISSLILVNNKNKNKTTIVFKKHLEFKNRYYPKTIEIISNTGGSETKEVIHYNKIEFNKEIPPEKFKLIIPEGTTVEKIDMK